MSDFLTGLQFLTRLRLKTETEWSAERFGRSVKYFPLIGAVIGLVLLTLCLLVQKALPALGIAVPIHVFAALLITANIVVTGGLHCDGFMDTMDGVFSGRSRERMLEIMKDSRVGANGVMSFMLLLLVKWSLLLDVPAVLLPAVVFVMPVAGRMAMVLGVTQFPYARPDGMGKAFAQYADRNTAFTAAAFTILACLAAGVPAAVTGLAAVAASLFISRYITNVLGGLTGDAYGAVSELTELLVLFFYWIMSTTHYL